MAELTHIPMRGQIRVLFTCLGRNLHTNAATMLAMTLDWIENLP